MPAPRHEPDIPLPQTRQIDFVPGVPTERYKSRVTNGPALPPPRVVGGSMEEECPDIRFIDYDRMWPEIRTFVFKNAVRQPRRFDGIAVETVEPVEQDEPKKAEEKISLAAGFVGGDAEIDEELLDDSDNDSELSPDDQDDIDELTAAIEGTDVRVRHDGGAERRRKGRIKVELLECDLGDVVDLSASGMRVRRKAKKAPNDDEVMELTLTHLEGELPLKARVVWTKKSGFRKFDMGMEFVEMNEQAQSELNQIIRVSACQTTLGQTGT